jgi:hypothetical protein
MSWAVIRSILEVKTPDSSGYAGARSYQERSVIP